MRQARLVPLTVLVPVIRPDGSRQVVTPDEDVPLIRPCASRQVVFVSLVLEVPIILPWASRKVVLPLLDFVAVPVNLPWAPLKVVLLPEVLVVAVDLPSRL